MSQTQTMTKEEKIEKAIDKGVVAKVPAVREGNKLSLLPTTLHEAMEFAKVVATSDVGLRKAFRGNVGACLALCYEAWDSGLPVFQVASKAYVVNDQIAFEAQYIHAKVNMRAPLARRLRTEYAGEGQNRRVIVKGWLKGEDEPFVYESPAIKDIAVKNSPLWKGEPDQQLHYYGVRAWARRYVPEILLGAYTPDEIEAGLADDAPRVDLTPEERAAAREARPQRGVPAEDAIIDTEEETISFDLTDKDGEIRSYADLADYDSAFAAAMRELAQAGDRDELQAYWDRNTGCFGQLRQMGGVGEEIVNGLTALFRELEAALAQREAEQRQAKQQQTAQDFSATANTAPAAPAQSGGSAPANSPLPYQFWPLDGDAVACNADGFAANMERAIAAAHPNRVNELMSRNIKGLERLYAADPEVAHPRIVKAAKDKGWIG